MAQSKKDGPVRIAALEVERFKRIRAIEVTPTSTGITVIGGGNGQGKTSILDAIAYALGGGKFKPSEANNRDSEKPASITVTLSSGLVVERYGEKGTLKVMDPGGLKGSQALLNEFIEELALNLPKFMASQKKVETLLKIAGVEDELAKLDKRHDEAYQLRRDAGRDLVSAETVLKPMPFHDDAPGRSIDIGAQSERVKKAREEHEEHRRRENLKEEKEGYYADLQAQIEALDQELLIKRKALVEVAGDIKTMQETFDTTTLPDLEAMEKKLAGAEEVNQKVRANKAYEVQQKLAKEAKKVHEDLAALIEKIRDQRVRLLDGAKMPLEGLAVNAEGELTYKGAAWDCMGSAEQMIVGASIVQQLNPKCGFVLLDKLELLDVETLKRFGTWAKKAGLQVIATRVSDGGECTLIIEDGSVKA